uniref:Uncharacterized protein n=1 Tax=Oryza brachyantha TaxID=4533 RepID=J3MT34_ORYBR
MELNPSNFFCIVNDYARKQDVFPQTAVNFRLYHEFQVSHVYSINMISMRKTL